MKDILDFWKEKFLLQYIILIKFRIVIRIFIFLIIIISIARSLLRIQSQFW